MPLCHPENNACGLQLSAERKGELLPKVGRADRLLGVNPLTRQTFAKRGETGGGGPCQAPLASGGVGRIFYFYYN